jgi:hypothetical protein
MRKCRRRRRCSHSQDLLISEWSTMWTTCAAHSGRLFVHEIKSRTCLTLTSGPQLSFTPLFSSRSCY